MSIKREPRCPGCGRIKAVQRMGDQFRCSACGALFDDDPDEGGTFDDQDPSRRIVREESIRRAKARRDA